MMLLHSQNLINGNLKPENVLIDDDYKPHLTDFCLLKIFESDLSKNPCCGTAAYMAPEVITSDILNEKTDVYSFGILMFEVVTGTRAYAEQSNKGFISAANLLMKVVNGFRPIFSTEVKPTLKQMIEKCWSEDPYKRPTFSEIYNKLSLTADGYFNDTNSKICKSIIETEDDDEMFNLSNKFCFDDVDIQKLFSYVNEIKVENNSEEIESLKKEIESLKKEIESLKKEIESLKKEINKMKNYQNQNENQYNSSKENKDKTTQTDFQQVKEKTNQTKNEMKQYARTTLFGGYDYIKLFGVGPVINPPRNLSLECSLLLSYSIYSNHSVLVTKDGSLLDIGNNTRGNISNSLPKTSISQFTKFSINNIDPQFAPISAVCSNYGTLYLFSKSSGDERKLVYISSDKSDGPVFFDIGDEKPVSLFGGCDHAAAINDKGEVIYVRRSSATKSPNQRISAVSLPDGEKASSVAFYYYSVIILSSKGRVFSSPQHNFPFTNINLSFSLVSELSGYEIVWLSGTYGHCLAVSKEGRVFGLGSNSRGQLSLGEETESVSSFTEISSLLGYEIRAAYAGYYHSLFETREGKILSCGNNEHGQLLLNRIPSFKRVYSPKETTITGGATFCIAGFNFSIVFVGGYPPPNTPNIPIKYHQ